MTLDKLNIDAVKDHIVFKLINREKHEEKLKDVPYIDYMDLAIVFYYYIPEIHVEDGNLSIMITNSNIREWKVDVNFLMEAAMENTPRLLGLRVRGIFSTIADYLKDEELAQMAELEDINTPIYVATNNNACHGASVILYKHMLQAMAAKVKSNLYIIPCSIHELIILQAIEDVEYDTTELKEMIQYVNRNELRPSDVLSDNLYFYNRVSGELGIA